jgi:hypothetical protein
MTIPFQTRSEITYRPTKSANVCARPKRAILISSQSEGNRVVQLNSRVGGEVANKPDKQSADHSRTSTSNDGATLESAITKKSDDHGLQVCARA